MARRSRKNKNAKSAAKASSGAASAESIATESLTAESPATTATPESTTEPGPPHVRLGERKIKRNWPFLVASCVALLIWFGFLGFLAYGRLKP